MVSTISSQHCKPILKKEFISILISISVMVLSKTVICNKFGVASEHPLASLAGLEVLQKGGNAVDAAFATSFAIAVTQHPLGGIGGDFFSFYFDSQKEKLFCLNSSGWAPSGAGIEISSKERQSKITNFGPLSVVVPGMVAGLFEFHSRFGSVGPKTLMRRAIELAEDGFPVSNNLAKTISLYFSDLPEEAKSVFGISGRPIRACETLKQQKLAKTLRRIASEGPSAFYDGKVALSIINTLNKKNELFTLEDFRSFEPEWVNPINTDYRGTRIFEMPPNTMGPVTIRIIDHLKRYKFDFEANSRKRVELFVRIYEDAYSWKERYLGDPRFSSYVTSGSTTSFTTVDKEGNFTVAIQSLYHHFGSRVYVPDVGIFLNNRASAFSTEGPNSIKPRKRPVHTLSTFLLQQGERKIGLGTSGGDFRPQLHTLFLTNIVDWRMTLEEAIDFPRFLWQKEKELITESGYKLDSSGFKVDERPYPSHTGVASGVEIGDGYKKLVCDVRGDGIPAGL